ncbi:rRNA biogenesis protein RRP5 [Entomortierella parvispora]|uniref:Protein RRP5 homolog n=1 Tax=Entomortierella parvispora TaxID=205924 RepID=A0A9P3HEB6_9FUNG|nr:rRNA biogenesis protein RRP5 [Entomortierella parvispora]
MSSTKEFKAPVTKRKQKEEEDFPRGGASGLTPLEYKEVAHQADSSLFSEPGKTATTESGEPLKKKRKPTKKPVSNVTNFENTFDKKQLNVEILSFKRLTEGTKVLGCISAIGRSRDSDLPELVVALPNNLTGYVNIAEISDELIQNAGDTLPDLSSMFFIGQWVQCVIIGLQQGATGGTAASGTDKHRRKVILSMKPFIVNAGVKPADIATGTIIAGAVQSVEDHGYIVSLGMNGMHGFLKNSEAKMYQRIKNNDKPLSEGQVLAFSVVSVDGNKKTVQLTVDAMKVSKALLGDKFAYSEISSIMPGNVIEAHITGIQDIGALCKFMGHFDATIDYFHTSKGLITSKKDLEETFKINDKVRARVLYIDLASTPTRIGLSNAKHVMGLTQPSTTEEQIGAKVYPGNAIPVGKTFDTITVKRVDARHGLLCTIDGTDIPGYVHISRVSDEHLATISATGKHRVDSTHRGVVLGYDPVDGLFQLSLQQAMLDEPFLRVEDIKVGSVLKGTVFKKTDKGVVVQLTKTIRGFVPLIHCVDSVITSSTKKHVDEKFQEGKPVKCRVLSTDPVEGKVTLTCKTTLVTSKNPIITSFGDVTPGTLSEGVILKTNAHGCIVSFYNNIKAFAHISQLQEAHVTNLNIFQPGQVKTCRVLEVDPEAQTMKVSFKKSSEIDLSNIAVGSLQKGKIVTIKKDIIHITLKPSEVKAVLPVGHLSDHLGEQADRIYKSLKEGMVLSDLVVLNKDETRGSVLVSKKPLLVLASKENKLITERKQVKVDHIYPASVRQVATFGVFVEFCGGVDALALKSGLSDMSDTTFVKDQSILVKVTKIDPADGKIQVTLKPSEIGYEGDSIHFQGEFLSSYFKQLERLAKQTNSALAVGACTTVEVKAVTADHWTVAYGNDESGQISAEQTKGKGKAGAKFPAKVLDVDFEKGTVDFTIKDSLLTAEETKGAEAGKFSSANAAKDLSKLKELQKSQEAFEAVVELVKEDYVVLSIPQVNNMIAFAATRSYNNRRDRFISYKVGEKVRVLAAHVPKSQGKGQTAERVVVVIEQAVAVKNGASKDSKKVALSAVHSFEDVLEGELTSGRISGVQHTGLNVHLGGKVYGHIHVSDIADTYASADELLKGFKKGQVVKCYVLRVDSSNKKIDLSLRPSRLSPESHSIVRDPEVKSIKDLTAGSIFQGFVSNVADKGLFVALSHKVSARVKIAELSDDYLKDWKSHFTVGQLVKAKVVSVNEARNQVELTLKASQIDPSIKANKTLADFTKGEKVKGTIKAVKDIGVFIKIDNSMVSGLCHISEISENHVPDVSKLYAVGDPVKAKILDIDLEKKRISFGLKSSYFEEADAEEGVEDSEDEGVEAEDEDEEMEDASDEDIIMADDDSDVSDDDEDEEDEDVENIFAGHDSDSDEAEEEDEDTKAGDDDSDVEMSEAAPLAVSSGFNWDGKDDAEDSKSQASDSEDDSDDEVSNKKKKAKKQAAVVSDDTADLESQAPQISSDYERLLLGSPNSSYLWINYMAFQLQLSEIQKAREIGQRALKTISFREEQEKMNVWVALMNLENTFGSADTLEEVFKNAVQTCEPKKVYLQLVKIYERSNKIDRATELYNTMTKKFGQSSKVWTGFGHFQLHHGNLESGRELLQRSLKSLPKRKHIKTISKFAQLEFKYGEPERGRTIFEGVMSNYPKRIDLWSVYIDMEVRNGEQDAVRRLFARVVSLKLSSKKMKFFFKKWLAYEKDNGDEEHIEEVKRRAMAYVESLSA